MDLISEVIIKNKNVLCTTLIFQTRDALGTTFYFFEFDEMIYTPESSTIQALFQINSLKI